MKVTQHLWFEKDMEAIDLFNHSLSIMVECDTRVAEAMLKMVKFDIAELETAVRGKSVFQRSGDRFASRKRVK